MWRLFKCLPVLAFLNLAGCGPEAEGANMADNPYPITVQLDTAQVDQRFPTPEMRYLYADLSSTGQAKIKFGSPSNQALTLIPGSNYPITADDIFLTYEAQPGKKLELLHSASPIGGGGNRTMTDASVSPSTYVNLDSTASLGFTVFAASQNSKGIKIHGGTLAVIMSSSIAVGTVCTTYLYSIGAKTIYLVAANGTAAGISPSQPIQTTIPAMYVPPGYSLIVAKSSVASASILLNYEILQ